MTVRAAVAAFLLVLSSTMAATAGGQAGSLCVERTEDEGAVNIYPVEFKIDEKLTRTFLGGTKECLSLPAGTHNIELSWPIFDWQQPDHGLHGTARDNELALAVIRSNKKTIMAICSVRSEHQVRWRIANGDVRDCR